MWYSEVLVTAKHRSKYQEERLYLQVCVTMKAL